jgi:hypothetical protein
MKSRKIPEAVQECDAVDLLFPHVTEETEKEELREALVTLFTPQFDEEDFDEEV